MQLKFVLFVKVFGIDIVPFFKSRAANGLKLKILFNRDGMAIFKFQDRNTLSESGTRLCLVILFKIGWEPHKQGSGKDQVKNSKLGFNLLPVNSAIESSYQNQTHFLPTFEVLSINAIWISKIQS